MAPPTRCFGQQFHANADEIVDHGGELEIDILAAPPPEATINARVAS